MAKNTPTANAKTDTAKDAPKVTAATDPAPVSEPIPAADPALAETGAVLVPAEPVGAGVAEADASMATPAAAAIAAATSGAVTGPHVTVVGPERGRRRIGRAFGREPIRIPLSELSQAEIAELERDPALAVSVIRG